MAMALPSMQCFYLSFKWIFKLFVKKDLTDFQIKVAFDYSIVLNFPLELYTSHENLIFGANCWPENEKGAAAGCTGNKRSDKCGYFQHSSEDKGRRAHAAPWPAKSATQHLH
jgi:hypothetical protein